MRSVLRLYRSAFGGLGREVWLLCAVLLVNRAGTMVLPFIALYLTREHGFDVAFAGRLLSLYGVGAMIGSYLGGWLSDRLGSLRAQRLSLIATGVTLLIFPVFDDPWLISVLLLLLATVGESLRPASMAAIAEVAPAEAQTRAYALLRLAGNAGMAVGPALGGWLALYDYSWLFVVDGVTCWLAAGLLLLVPSRRGRGGVASDTSRAVNGRSPWRDGPFLLLMLLVVAIATVLFQVFATLPLYLRQVYAMQENAIGMLIGLNAVQIVAFEMVLVHRVERWPRMPVIAAGSFLLCAGFGLLPFGSSVAFAGFTVVVWTLGEMLALPILNVVVAERAAPGNRGRYMGLYSMAYSVAFVLAPAGGTWVFERFGPEALWYGTLVLAPLLGLAPLTLGRRF